MNRLFIQPSDYLAPISQQEEKLLQKWKNNEITNKQKNEIKLTILGYTIFSSTIFGIFGLYLINSMVKDVETQSIKKMENESKIILDRIKKAEFEYNRTTEISNQMLKIKKYKTSVQAFCCIMGLSYGLAQSRLYFKDKAEQL